MEESQKLLISTCTHCKDSFKYSDEKYLPDNCKQCDAPLKPESKMLFKAEKNTFEAGSLILFFGILSSFALLITAIYYFQDRNYDISGTPFLITALAVFLGSLFQFYILKMLSYISISLKILRSKAE